MDRIWEEWGAWVWEALIRIKYLKCLWGEVEWEEWEEWVGWVEWVEWMGWVGWVGWVEWGVEVNHPKRLISNKKEDNFQDLAISEASVVGSMILVLVLKISHYSETLINSIKKVNKNELTNFSDILILF